MQMIRIKKKTKEGRRVRVCVRACTRAPSAPRVESCARGQVLDELMDGDIIVFERADNRHEELELPTCQDYFKYIFYKVEVQFVDKTVPNDTGYARITTLF